MKVLKLVAIVLCLSVFSISCSEDDGAMGPQGIQGEQGNQGDQGETGTANVIYSDWIERDWGSSVSQGFNLQSIDVIINKDQDALLMYGRKNNTSVYTLPYFHPNNAEYFGYTLGDTNILITASTTDGGISLFTFFDDFRYVIIPGGKPASSKSKTTSNTKNSQVDYTKLSYKEVIELLNIPE